MATVRKRKWTHKGIENEAWVCEYTDASGTRRRKTFEKKKDADKFRDKVAMEVRNGEHTPDRDTLTVRALADLYLDHIKTRVLAGTMGRTTAIRYEITIRKNIVPLLGNKKVAELTIKDVGDFTNAMIVEHGLSSTTAFSRRLTLQQMEKWARSRGYTKRAVVEDAAAEYRLRRDATIRVPSSDEVTSILEAVQNRWPSCQEEVALKRRLFIHITAFCGLRYGEICGLPLQCIDFERKRIQVRWNLTELNEHKSPKTEAGNREVPCPEHIIEMLKEWVSKYYRPNQRQLIFADKSGNVITKGPFHRNYWTPTLKRAGLYRAGADNLHFHSLRHFAGSWWLEHGIPLPLVSKLLGHSRPDVTMRVYAYVLRKMEQQQAAIDTTAAALLAYGRDKNATTAANTLI